MAVASRGWRRLALGGGYSVKEEEQDPDLVPPNHEDDCSGGRILPFLVMPAATPVLEDETYDDCSPDRARGEGGITGGPRRMTAGGRRRI